MINSQQVTYERYRRKVFPIGWRVQYRSNKIKGTEVPIEDNEIREDFTSTQDNKIFVEELINKLPNEENLLLRKIYIEGYKEAEISQQLKISQQAVNKWKKKLLNYLFRII
ncbi:sigma factor-like helix-turn-helix DNA-binding protein [Paenibacillus sp. FSL R7-0652]|uniref:sigma factor-like helix-turn-helix DNA-binding protein n=1 Tax=Paenibacillus sp. FSL R7-0652 TaxID=2921687 RepID=UPI00315A28F3